MTQCTHPHKNTKDHTPIWYRVGSNHKRHWHHTQTHTHITTSTRLHTPLHHLHTPPHTTTPPPHTTTHLYTTSTPHHTPPHTTTHLHTSLQHRPSIHILLLVGRLIRSVCSTQVSRNVVHRRSSFTILMMCRLLKDLLRNLLHTHAPPNTPHPPTHTVFYSHSWCQWSHLPHQLSE